jgi:anti-sigma B factor antagonist
MTRPWQSTAWVDVSQEPGTLVLHLGGELDMASRDVIESAVMAAIPSAYKVVLDLSDLTFCDSSGIAMFVAASEKARAEGVQLTLENLQPRVAHVFEVTGVGPLLEINA